MENYPQADDAGGHDLNVSIGPLVHGNRQPVKRTGWSGVCVYGRIDRVLRDLDEWRGKEMIGQIVSSLGGLAKSYIDSKTQIKITEAEIKKKQLTGEIDWEQSAIEASKDSWKDELWTIVFVAILVANFIPALQDSMARGFANLEETPLWVQWGMYASIAASFGIRTMKGLKK